MKEVLAIVSLDEEGNVLGFSPIRESTQEEFEARELDTEKRIKSIRDMLEGLFTVGITSGLFYEEGINREALTVGRVVNGIYNWIETQKAQGEKLPDLLSNTLVLTALKALRKENEPAMEVDSKLLHASINQFMQANADLLPGLPEWFEKVEAQMYKPIEAEEVLPPKKRSWF